MTHYNNASSQSSYPLSKLSFSRLQVLATLSSTYFAICQISYQYFLKSFHNL
ncbi:hypothetical protein CWATWH0401_4931 [Crocosphaera watsonii WH 0401]|uniref:Uncharacterized protein n=1 Tax=Crocosphaera watsonii WH 0401 TaxID=555881 RepID=T2JFG9_CROWT|nr:hypothetical protein CWATWH0401_4931 [Crocosphaera watsonii WH 0401]